MNGLSREDRRRNRAHVLEALHAETGSWGGSAAEPRVKAYVADPEGAPTAEFGYVGALTLQRFYVDPAKPNQAERRSLWQELLERIGNPGAADPGGWDGSTMVLTLQAIAEEA